ncbi:MAG: DUF4258 domain-containing protein [Deltaproteobacteria bacterium]|nr:DUF4258 domain-containing protein [Deltaproteobacteria bacterium]
MQWFFSVSQREKFILKEIRAGNFVLTVHARERMNERFISELDIVEVAKTLRSILYQKKNDTYLLTGLSTWKEKLMVSAAVRGKVIIVTVFCEEQI